MTVLKELEKRVKGIKKFRPPTAMERGDKPSIAPLNDELKRLYTLGQILRDEYKQIIDKKNEVALRLKAGGLSGVTSTEFLVRASDATDSQRNDLREIAKLEDQRIMKLRWIKQVDSLFWLEAYESTRVLEGYPSAQPSSDWQFFDYDAPEEEKPYVGLVVIP